MGCSTVTCNVSVVVFVCCLVVSCADGQVNNINKIQPTDKTAKVERQVKLKCPNKSTFLALPCDIDSDCAILGAGPKTLCCRGRCLEGVPEISAKMKKLAAKSALKNTQAEYVCPYTDPPFFSLPCDSTSDCAIFGQASLCCKNRCVDGVIPPSPLAEITHEPLLFGLVERICSADPIPELSIIQECLTDVECNPRICCPDKPNASGKVKYYCRTAAADLEKLPAPRQILDPIKTAIGYMQCTPPPPPILDVFPKPCESSFDCFPNLCCQENGKRYCRPPKRSLLALVADVSQRFGTSELAKKAIERITT